MPLAVFGFSQDDVPLILREFGKCGDIRQFGTFGEGGGVNWIHIQYAVSRAGGWAGHLPGAAAPDWVMF